MNEEREEALSVLRRDYWSDVRGVIAAAREESFESLEELGEWLSETVDGHQRVIYTGLAIETLLFSDNEDSYVDVYGAELPTLDGEALNWSAIAYFAFEADIVEHPEWHDIVESIKED